jgi:hypothetical protein
MRIQPLLLTLPRLFPLYRVHLPQGVFNRPDEPHFCFTGLAFVHSDEVLHKCHADIGTNAREDMPPAMQFK